MSSFTIKDEDVIDANIYIVCRIGWEYNDEYYYRPEYEGGTPVNAFTVRTLAEELCKTKNCKWFIDALKGEYLISNPASYLDCSWYPKSEIEKEVEKVEHLSWDHNNFTSEDPHLIKYDHLSELIKNLELEQYEVVEVTLTA